VGTLADFRVITEEVTSADHVRWVGGRLFTDCARAAIRLLVAKNSVAFGGRRPMRADTI
jgi:hypothetical protein